MVDLDHCQKALSVSFNNETLLMQALVHSSYLNENQDFRWPSNERLEFIGDAVLGLVVAERLYSEFPETNEGWLTTMRAYLVCQDTLAEVASSLKLGDWLLMGRGEDVTGGRSKQSNLANGLEALIGAIYLDQGLSRVKGFIFEQVEPFLKRIKSGKVSLNYKALLQEFAQKENMSIPVYRVVKVAGPEHDKRFTVEVVMGDEVIGVGTGKNKKAAEMEASQLAWAKVRYNHG